MPKEPSKDAAQQPEMAQQLLASFSLSSQGTTLCEAVHSYIEANRRRFDPELIQFIAACAIEAGDNALAAALLGRAVLPGEKLTP